MFERSKSLLFTDLIGLIKQNTYKALKKKKSHFSNINNFVPLSGYPGTKKIFLV